MSRTLTFNSSIETLKKEAKRWLKAIRAGDRAARARLEAAGVESEAPTLRDVQFALAREHGLPGWQSLLQALDDHALAKRTQAERVEIVLRSAWDGGDRNAAQRILARWPELAEHSLATAVACGRTECVARLLASDRTLASRQFGQLDWEPLLYLAYARLSSEADAVAIARLLLECGADANARFDDGWGNAFTVLTGVIGEGEGDRLAHPQSRLLVDVLIDHGADPFDKQALYNTSITRDDTTWLQILWDSCERRGVVSKWREDSAKIGGRLPVNALDYLLGNAVAYNHPRRAEWLLQHGANANAAHAYSSRPLRSESLVYGYTAMADLLVAHGAQASPLEGHAAFVAACMALDREDARALASDHPEYLANAEPMMMATRAGRVDVVQLLLDLGMHVDVADSTQQRGLHNAAASGAIEVAQLLIAHGADVDRPTMQYGGPMGFAAYFGQRAIAELLAPLSRDVHHLAYFGMKDRLHALFANEPQLANLRRRDGLTPLFALPDDEELAAEMAEFLIAHGADAAVTNTDGDTAIDVARQRGLHDAVDAMKGD